MSALPSSRSSCLIRLTPDASSSDRAELEQTSPPQAAAWSAPGIGFRLLLEKGDGETAPGQLQRDCNRQLPATDKELFAVWSWILWGKSSRAPIRRNRRKGWRETAARAERPLLRPPYATLQEASATISALEPHMDFIWFFLSIAAQLLA